MANDGQYVYIYIYILLTHGITWLNIVDDDLKWSIMASDGEQWPINDC